MIICNFEHENVGICNGKQFSQWRCLIAYTKHVKAVSRSFVLAITINKVLTFDTFDLEKAGQGH